MKMMNNFKINILNKKMCMLWIKDRQRYEWK